MQCITPRVCGDEITSHECGQTSCTRVGLFKGHTILSITMINNKTIHVFWLPSPIPLLQTNCAPSPSFARFCESRISSFKLKLKGLKAEKLLSACASKEDLIELILQSEDCQVEPIHSTLIEMARRKKIKNHTILTKYELKKALGLTTENKPRSRSYISSNSPEESFEFATRKDAMDGMNLSSTKLARGIKNGKILIGNIEYKFERK